MRGCFAAASLAPLMPQKSLSWCGAGQSKIKSLYRKLSVKHHPDKGGDPEIFNEIRDAYEILSDTNKRKVNPIHRPFCVVASHHPARLGQTARLKGS